jgi:hypothetical protein
MSEPREPVLEREDVQTTVEVQTVIMQGDVVVTGEQQVVEKFFRDGNFGKGTTAWHIALARKLSEGRTTNAERIKLLEVIFHNIANLDISI